MASLPPGILYLIQSLPSLLAPPATVVLLARLANDYLVSNGIPSWLIVVLATLSLPATITGKVLYKNWKDERDAAAHNAILPPRVKDPTNLPAGLGILRATVAQFTHGYPGETFAGWFEEEKSNMVNFRPIYEDRLLTMEPDHLKAILATQFDAFDKGPVFQESMRPLLGSGVFNSDGEMWKFHRAMTRPFFNRDRISHFDIFDRHAQDVLNQVSARLREGFPVDMQDLTSRFAMDSATEFLFGQDVCSLSAGLPYPHYASTPAAVRYAAMAASHPANQFSRAFDDVQHILGLRARRGLHWPLGEFWKDQVEDRMKVIKSFIDPVVKTAIERKGGVASIGNTDWEKEGGMDREVNEDDTLLDHLINYTKDEKVLRDEVLNILLAGRDTTTNTITYGVYMLSKHPEVLRKLRQEVLEKVGESRRPTFEDMKDMKYMRAFINETLRLFPAVPFNIRTSNRPVVFPAKNGNPAYYIPAGTKVGYALLNMQRREDLWGPDAQEFDPERFLDERAKKYLTRNPFVFLPFNAGPRICLGQQFAYNETSFFLIRLLQRFSDIRHAYDAQPPDSRPPPSWKGARGRKGSDDIRIKTYLTMGVMGGCWVTLEEADTARVD